MAVSFLDVLVLLGGLQGFIVAAILFLSKRSGITNRLLGTLLLLMSLASLNIFLINQPWFNQSTALNIAHEIIPMVIFMPAGPLIYFYIRSFYERDFRIERAQRIHFYSVILDLIPHVVVLIYIFGILAGFLKSGNPAWGSFVDQYNTYVDIPRWISLLLYLWLSFKYMRLNRLKIKAIKPEISTWPGQLIIAFGIFLIIWLLHLIPYIIPAYSDKMLNLVGWYPIYIPGAIIIYWLSIKSYQLIYQQIMQEKRTSILLSSLSGSAIGEAIKRLKDSMEKDKAFLNPDLNLNMLAEHTGLSAKLISAILNQELNSSFSGFINEYRIKEIKHRILQPMNNNLTIAGIAFDCGFNSQPTFQRVFKASTGLTPTEFLQKSIQNQE
ncbi:MAG: helix-turn-helix domain-containing protein [Chitinophagales bacterium]